MLKAFLTREGRLFRGAVEGQGLVEYALILVLISVVVIGVLTLLGQSIEATFETINNAISGGG